VERDHSQIQGKPAAEEAEQDFVAKPDDQLNQSAFANQLRKILGKRSGGRGEKYLSGDTHVA
jgi:hypothetical protein